MILSDKLSFTILTVETGEFNGLNMLPIGGLVNLDIFEAAITIMTGMNLQIDDCFVSQVREIYKNSDYILFNVRDREVITKGGGNNG